MAKKLFIGSLSWDTTDASLREFFSQFGNVDTANVVMDKFSGKSRGFGFVEFATEEEAQKAVSEANGKTLDGREINVSEARPQEPRQNGGGNFNRGGGGFDRNRGGGGNRGGHGGGNRRNDY